MKPILSLLTGRAYKLFKQAAEAGHIGAKEELAFAHLIGVHLPMDFNQANLYFEEGAQLGSAQSHFVRSSRSLMDGGKMVSFFFSLGTVFYE